MEKLTVNKMLEILEGEAESIQNYEDYRIVCDCIDQMKEIFEDNENAKTKKYKVKLGMVHGIVDMRYLDEDDMTFQTHEFMTQEEAEAFANLYVDDCFHTTDGDNVVEVSIEKI